MLNFLFSFYLCRFCGYTPRNHAICNLLHMQYLFFNFSGKKIILSLLLDTERTPMSAIVIFPA